MAHQGIQYFAAPPPMSLPAAPASGACRPPRQQPKHFIGNVTGYIQNGGYRPRTGPNSTEEVSAKHPRPDDDEDTPAPKHRGIARSLRQRGPKGPQKEIVVAVPVRRIVASGKGWVEIEADDDI
ncbi:hypothetical protein C8F04DRAFT_1196631 [Mycena alexandri]|uniref:Uncharacterized protein n=1 Tax=Mycena alexandri TaxID=1745969 RepID=A0AAD6WPM9_9AGAR|nr:hypothetical protein C8F04DRAFT_1196631 [Mycena alexandri]